MLLMIPKGYEQAAPDTRPEAAAVEKMMRYNGRLKEAGVLLTLDGLHPPTKGARVTFSNGQAQVIEAPFPGVTEVLGGFWILDVASREAAIDWARQCPAGDNEVIEVRQVFEFQDFSPEVQQAASGFKAMQQGNA
jgi:hypothetical protein